MITKRTILERIEVEQSGAFFAQLQKQVLDGEAVLWSEPHRCVFDLLHPVDVQLSNLNAALALVTTAAGVVNPFPPISESDAALIAAHFKTAATPELVAVLGARRAAQEIAAKTAAAEAEAAPTAPV